MNQSTVCVPKARELPEGFVYIDELIEDCIIDAKYAGTDNFMGRPADGYEQPLVVMTTSGCSYPSAGRPIKLSVPAYFASMMQSSISSSI